MKYHLGLSRRAEKEFLKLPFSIAKHVSKVISDLKTDPRPPSCIKLTGSESEYRIRIGDYRILYEISDNEQTVTIYRIRHRKEAYR